MYKEYFDIKGLLLLFFIINIYGHRLALKKLEIVCSALAAP